MKLHNESLQDFDALLKSCMEKSQKRAKFTSHSREQYLKEVAEGMRVELDHTKTKLSELIYNIDLAMCHNADTQQKRNIYEVLKNQNQPKPISDDELRRKYVRKTPTGFDVYNKSFGQWVSFSNQSEINITIEKSGNQAPVVKVKAFEASTNQTINYEDTYLATSNTYNTASYGYTNSQTDNYMHFSDRLYNSSGIANGAVGTTAGTLEAFYLGSSQYQNGLNLFDKKIIDGKWQAKNGNWHKFQDIDLQTNGFKKQSLKVSKNWVAKRSASNMSKAGKLGAVGKVSFVFTLGFAGVNSYDAYKNDDSNKNEVYAKSALDVTMGVIAFVPYVGWAIAGTYFILDVSGAFGDWEQASGMTVEEKKAHDEVLKREMSEMVSKYHFDIDCESPEGAKKSYLNEYIQQSIDNLSLIHI